MSRILVFDTTLRDGEQSPGSSMTSAEKLRMAHELAGLGVDILEAGFAASSTDENGAIRDIAREVPGPVVAALARATEGDVRTAASAVEGAHRPRVHVFIATSDLHLRYKLRISRDECIERTARAVELARSLVDGVESSAEGATRTDGVHPQPNKAVVGRNAFAHEAGIHQHGMLSEPRTYEIMTPAMVGAPASTLVLGKHSGRHGLESRYRDLGYVLTPEELDRVCTDFKALADRKKEVLDEDLLSILHHGAMDDVPEVHRVVELDVRCGGPVSRARVRLAARDGLPTEANAEGDGPIDAAFAAIEELVDFRIVLEDLRIRAATSGEDAMGEVSVQARVDGQTFAGRGAATDVVLASAQALLHVINKAEQARTLEARHLALTADAWAV